MATMGNYALMLALGFSVFGSLASALAAIYARERYRVAAVRAFLVTGACVAVAVVVLAYLIQTDQFTYAYVYRFSNRTLPSIFKYTAVWGGHEGSLLWWTLILCVYTSLVIWRTKRDSKWMMSWAYVFIGITLVFFLIINNMVANPFDLWAQVSPDGDIIPFTPKDGTGLNPQLHHWAMIIHPPLLYTGYIGFLFPYAIALGALITRMEGREWIALVRRWTLWAWMILTAGIVLGGAWAYMELGWGGYWAWDPVENASFMPWLLGTAFLHSVMAQETRGMFKVWSILLIAGTYLMCIFGTFITRSGLISSVHAFAESDIGRYFIVYLVINAILALGIVIYSRRQLRDDNTYVSVKSREVALIFNNVLFLTICLVMLLATMYPMITEWVYGTKQELRHGFYNTVELPIFIGLMAMMAIGPILTWKRTSNQSIKRRFPVPLIALVVVATIGFIFNDTSHMATVSFAVLAFLFVTIVQEFYEAGKRRKQRSGENWIVAWWSLMRMNRRRYGGYVVHFGVLLVAIGLTGSAFKAEDKADLSVGQTMEVGGYAFQVESIGQRSEDDYYALTAKVNLIENGKVISRFSPEQRVYRASDMNASEVSIDVTMQRDYYVVLAGTGEGHTAEHPVGVFHIYVNPLVIWLWIGTAIMIIGTLFCMYAPPLTVRVRQSVAATEMETA